MELILTGRMLGAAEAAQLHLLNRLVEPGSALEGARELADAIVKNAPLALQVSKAVLTQSPDWSLSERFDRQREATAVIRSSNDAQRGEL